MGHQYRVVCHGTQLVVSFEEVHHVLGFEEDSFLGSLHILECVQYGITHNPDRVPGHDIDHTPEFLSECGLLLGQSSLAPRAVSVLRKVVATKGLAKFGFVSFGFDAPRFDLMRNNFRHVVEAYSTHSFEGR